MNKVKYVFLFFAVFLFSVTVNEYNIYLIKKSTSYTPEVNSKSLVFNETIFSIDNEYYLSPVENFLKSNEWKRSPGIGDGDYFRRTPGYSLIYLSFVKPFGFQIGHLFIKYFQELLFSLSACFFFFINLYYYKSKFLAITLTLIYSFFPFFSVWTSYTLTEAITPMLIVSYLFIVLKAYTHTNHLVKISLYVLASFLVTFLTLTRPYTAISGLILLVYFFNDYNYVLAVSVNKFLYKAALISLFPIIMIGSWTIRNYVLTSELVVLEKAFHPQSLDRMKPEFEGMLNFSKCWGEDGAFFNTYYQPLYTAALKGDTSSIYIRNVLSSWPKEIISEYGYTSLYSVIKIHQEVLYKQKIFFDKQIAMPSNYLPEQVLVKEKYNELIKSYKKKHFFSYWFISPIVYLKRMIFHSNTAHIFFFQEEHRNNVIFNIIRFSMFIIHVLVYFALFFNLFFLKRSIHKIAIVYLPILFILFFSVFHREIEQRYMLPVLPIIIVGLGFTINYLSRLMFSKSFVNNDLHKN
jgi:hypothetical protein